MARKRKTRPATEKAHMDRYAPTWDGQTMARPQNDLPPRKQGVAKAHEKHKNDLIISESPTTQATLASRFDSLPSEIRSHIFSFLLTRPVKWDIPHKSDCSLRKNNVDITPESCDYGLCADVFRFQRGWPEISANPDPWTSPWRSQWAPEQRNPYLCSICYDERLRPKPFPITKSLPCLCARRDNLQILLVSKKWYREAGTVFYTTNTFAFEENTTLIGFVGFLNPIWKHSISKISLMTPSSEMSDSSRRDSEKCTTHMYIALRHLPSLSHLELDSTFLAKLKLVKGFIRTGLRNLRGCSFVERLPEGTQFNQGSEHVFPHFAGRTLVKGGFAEEVARAIKGQRQKQLKKRSLIEIAVGKMQREAVATALSQKLES